MKKILSPIYTILALLLLFNFVSCSNDSKIDNGTNAVTTGSTDNTTNEQNEDAEVFFDTIKINGVNLSEGNL